MEDQLRATIAIQANRIRDLETALGLNNGNIASTFHLPSSLGRILGLLLAVPNVTHHMVQQQLEISADMKVAIHRLRGALDKYTTEEGIEPLEIQSKRSLGYWLDKETKERIRLLITPKVPHVPSPVPVAPDTPAEEVLDEDLLNEVMDIAS